MATISEIVPSVLNHLVGNRVYRSATPDTLVRAGGVIADFIVFTSPGGDDEEYVDQTIAVTSGARIQLHALSATAIGADTLIMRARDAMLASGYTVGVIGSPMDTYDAARKLYGRLQHLSIKYRT